MIVSTPEEFDLDDTNKEVECATHPEQEGRMVCRFGDMAPGEEGRLNFRGEYRDHGAMRTHVSVESLTDDPVLGNNRDDERVSVHENERPEAVDLGACDGGPVRLIGGDSPSVPSPPDSTGDGIEVLSDLEVRLNGKTIFEDDDGQPEVNGPPLFSPLDPIEFQADNGDRLQIIANNGMFSGAFLDPLSLVCPDGSEQELTSGTFDPAPPAGSTFFDEEFVLALGGPSGP